MEQKLLEKLRYITSSELLLSIFIAVLVIGASVGLGYENNKVVPVNPSVSARYTLEPHNRLSFLSNWDGPIYLTIAKQGYTTSNQANFFPLYPTLVHCVAIVIRSTLDSALIVSWLCFVGAIYFYLKIIKKFFHITDNVMALRAVMFFILFPTSIFLIATYTESLFAFLSLGAIYCALQKKYIPAGLFALLATATHADGLLVVALLGLLLWEAKVKLVDIATSMTIGCFGFIGYMIYQTSHFHNPFAFLDAQKKHSWLNLSPLHFISELATLNGIFLLLLGITCVYWWQRKKSFSLYAFFYICIVLLGGKDLSGVGRYALMAFPLQFMFYDYFKDKKLGYPLVLAVLGIFWCFFTLRYAGGYTGG